MAAPILATKLFIPTIRPKMIQRPHLIQRLNEGLEINRHVTLVSAPAGFGKTTCICDWVTALDGWKAAWLSLDSLDDDPMRFFAYFIAALQTVHGNLGLEIEGVIGSGNLPPSEVISTTFINNLLACEARFILVLDDFHFIQDGFILQTLQYLIENIPDRLHLVLITREDPPLPLARLRANNQLTEIRARDLRFSRSEIDRFLREMMGLSFSQADIIALEDKTEGWIAGLQLATMAMNEPAVQQSLRLSHSVHDREDYSNFIASLSGSHRYILSYLTEQVLDQQSEEMRCFLLETSILANLNVDLCNAVSKRTDSDALLEQLFNANLFLIPLDGERRWYRYHHLFADLLRDLHHTHQKEKTSELHRRASRWFAQAGMVNDAIRHALAAEDYAGAVGLLESHAMELVMQGYAKTVNGWVQALPEEWCTRSPRTNLAFAWALLLRGAYTAAVLYLERLQTILTAQASGDDNAEIYAEWLVMQSLVLYMQGRLSECQGVVAKALKHTREQDHRVLSLAYYVQASVLRREECDHQAVKSYQKSIRESQMAASPVPEILSTASLTGMALEHGQLHMAFEIASQAVQRMERSGTLYPMSAMIYASLGEVCYQWYQLEAARRYFQQALHLSILGGANTTTILCQVLLSRLLLTEGDLETANREIQIAEDKLPLEAPDYVKQEVISQRIRISLALSRPAAAEVALQEMGVSITDLHTTFDLLIRLSDPDSSAQHISSSAGRLINSILCVLLYRSRIAEDPACIIPGIKFTDQIITRAIQSQQHLVVLETLLLRAQMQKVVGNETASTGDYVQALELAEPEGIISVFLEGGQPTAEALADLVMKRSVGRVQPGYIERILDAFSSLRSSKSDQPASYTPAADAGNESELVEPLTEREREVLLWMSEGLKYQEIGARLYISKNTVRYHVKAIYGKLQVNNRVQAIAKARQLHIL